MLANLVVQETKARIEMTPQGTNLTFAYPYYGPNTYMNN